MSFDRAELFVVRNRKRRARVYVNALDNPSASVERAGDDVAGAELYRAVDFAMAVGSASVDELDVPVSCPDHWRRVYAAGERDSV